MSVSEFKQRLTVCQAELDVRRLVHWHWAQVSGTHRELLECLQLANAAADRFMEDGVAIGGRGGAFIPEEVSGARCQVSGMEREAA